MFKVMLIGNDRHTREVLKNNIPWQSISAELACEMDVADTVLERFRQIIPEIVVLCVDWTEPSALDLAAKLMRENVKLKLILASEQQLGNEDFSAIEWADNSHSFQAVPFDDVADRLVQSIHDLQTNTGIAYHFPEDIHGCLLNLFRENNMNQIRSNIEDHVDVLRSYGNNSQHLVQEFLFEYVQNITKECFKCGFAIEQFKSYIPATISLMQGDDERCIQEVLKLTDQALKSISSYRTGGNYLLMQKAKNYIEDHLNDKNLCLETVSDHVGLSKSYFCKLFSRQMGGAGFSSYLNHLRIERAKQLLLETDLKIFEVSDAVGFSHARYFSQVFKESLGLTPVEFRHCNNN